MQFPVTTSLIIFLVLSFFMILPPAMSTTYSYEEAEITEEHTDMPIAEAALADKIDFDMSIEGMVETIPMNLIDVPELGFTVYYDAQRYDYKADTAASTVIISGTLSTDEQPVSLTITMFYDGEAQNADEQIAAILPEDMAGMENIEDAVINDYSAGVIRWKDDAADVLYRTYLIPTENGMLMAQIKVFSIAAEGHGARLEQTLETLKLR